MSNLLIWIRRLSINFIILINLSLIILLIFFTLIMKNKVLSYFDILKSILLNSLIH